MTKINCMIFGLSLVSGSIVAMDTKEWQHYNTRELELEQKRLSHAACMDRKIYLQRYGTPSRDATLQEIETYEDEMRHL